MDCSLPGSPIFLHLPELAETQVHWVGDIIPPPHLQSSPFPPASVFPSIRVFSDGPPHNSAHRTVLPSSPIIAPDKASKFYSSVMSSWQVRCPWPSKEVLLIHLFNLASKEGGCFFSSSVFSGLILPAWGVLRHDFWANIEGEANSATSQGFPGHDDWSSFLEFHVAWERMDLSYPKLFVTLLLNRIRLS